MGVSKDIGGDDGIRHVSGCGHLVNGKAGNAVHEDMVFIPLVKRIFFFVYLVGDRVDAEITVLICLWVVIRLKLVCKKSLWIVLGGISRNRSGIQADEGSVNNAFLFKEQNQRLHDAGQNVMVKIFKETSKRPVGRKRKGNVKTAVVSNEKVIIQIIDKVCNHGETFAFHYNKGTNHGMVGKAFASGFRVLLNGR